MTYVPGIRAEETLETMSHVSLLLDTRGESNGAVPNATGETPHIADALREGEGGREGGREGDGSEINFLLPCKFFLLNFFQIPVRDVGDNIRYLERARVCLWP